jgi:beta-lactamase class A
LPHIDFGIFAFGIENLKIFNSPLDGSGTKREKVDYDFKTEEPLPETQAAVPSQLSLEDFIVPGLAGILEKKAFFVTSASLTPPITIFDYLFFGLNSQIAKSAPKYLVYRSLEFPTQNYAPYALPQNDADYQSQATYEYEAALPAQRETTFQTAETRLYALPLIAPDDFFAGRLYHQPDIARNYDMPKHAMAALDDKFWQRSSSFLGNFSKEMLKSVNLDAKIPQMTDAYANPPKYAPIKNPKHALDVIVVKTPDVKPLSFSTYQINIQTQVPPRAAGKEDIGLIARANFYASQNQQKAVYNKTGQPNYDAPQRFLNIMSSGLWKNPYYFKENFKPVIKNSGWHFGKTGYGNRKYAKKSGNKNYKPKQEEAHTKKETPTFATRQKYGEKPAYSERKYKEEPDKRYESSKYGQINKKDEKQESGISNGSGVTTINSQGTNNNYSGFNGASFGTAVPYLGAAAILPFLGATALIAKTASLFQRSQEQPSKEQLKSLEYAIHNETAFSQQFREGIAPLLKDFEQLYGRVGLIIRYNKTGEQFAHNAKLLEEKKEKPAPSIVKLGIIITAQYYIQNGFLDPKKLIEFDPMYNKADKEEILLERETKDYSIFDYTKKEFNPNFRYEDLRPLVIRDSVNTATNLVLKFIGEGDVYEGIRRVNATLQKLGIKGVRLEEPYNRIFQYERNTVTDEGAELLVRFVSQGGKLEPEYLSPIREDMENERWMEAFRNMLPGVKSGSKVTIYKRGLGFVAFLDDYTISFLANDANDELYSDLARGASHLRQQLEDNRSAKETKNPYQDLNQQNNGAGYKTHERIVNDTFKTSSRKLEEMFKFFGHHFFGLTYKKPNAPVTPVQPAHPLY